MSTMSTRSSPRPADQELADPPFGQPGPVVQRGVEGTDPRDPRSLERLRCCLFAHRLVQASDGCAAKDQGRTAERHIHGQATLAWRHTGPAG